jgi:RNA polymerase subunit RPABC4/transcription elongation factor Spt4
MSELFDIVGETVGAILGHPLVGLALRLLALYLAVVWIASAWWTWRDARARSRDALVPYLASAGVILATPVLFPLAVVAYRVLRPPLTLAEEAAAQLQRAVLEEEAARPTCGRCRAFVEEEWLACPSCGTTLAVRCTACGRPLELDWRICAWCAAEVPWEAKARSPESPPTAAPVAIPIRPGGRPLVPVMAAPDESRAARPGAGSVRRRREPRSRAPGS